MCCYCGFNFSNIEIPSLLAHEYILVISIKTLKRLYLKLQLLWRINHTSLIEVFSLLQAQTIHNDICRAINSCICTEFRGDMYNKKFYFNFKTSILNSFLKLYLDLVLDILTFFLKCSCRAFISSVDLILLRRGRNLLWTQLVCNIQLGNRVSCPTTFISFVSTLLLNGSPVLLWPFLFSQNSQGQHTSAFEGYVIFWFCISSCFSSPPAPPPQKYYEFQARSCLYLPITLMYLSKCFFFTISCKP